MSVVSNHVSVAMHGILTICMCMYSGARGHRGEIGKGCDGYRPTNGWAPKVIDACGICGKHAQSTLTCSTATICMHAQNLHKTKFD
jgi:hypothetical protein